MKTIICTNQSCNKEYDANLKQCPFCGTENLQYEKPKEQSKESEGVRATIRIPIVIASGIVLFFICVAILALLPGKPPTLLMYLAVVIVFGVGNIINKKLKHWHKKDEEVLNKELKKENHE